MFGKQWDSILERSREVGIEGAAPQVHLLLAWCTVFEDEDRVRARIGEIEKLTVRKLGTSRDEPAPEWMKLQQILYFCVKIAKDNGAWLFNKNPERKFVQDKEALNGRALP